MDDKNLDTLVLDDDSHENTLPDNSVEVSKEEITPISLDFEFEGEEKNEEITKNKDEIINEDVLASNQNEELDLELSFENEFKEEIEKAVKEVEATGSELLEAETVKDEEIEAVKNKEELSKDEENEGLELSFEFSEDEDEVLDESKGLEELEEEPKIVKEGVNLELIQDVEEDIKESLEVKSKGDLPKVEISKTLKEPFKEQDKRLSKNKVNIGGVDLESLDIEDKSGSSDISNIEDYYLPEAKKKLPLDLIIGIACGAVVLFLVNFYFFSSSSEQVDQSSPVFSEILKEVKIKNRDKISDKEIKLVKHEVSFKDEFGKYDFNLTLKNSLLDSMNFELNFIEPKPLTDQEIVEGLSARPWIKKVMLEKISFVQNKTGSVVGVGKVKAYIVYKNKQKRSILNTKLSGNYNKSGVTLLLTLTNDNSYFTSKKEGLLVKLDESDDVKFSFVKSLNFKTN